MKTVVCDGTIDPLKSVSQDLHSHKGDSDLPVTPRDQFSV